MNETFAQDDFPQKVIVGVGAYRDDTGKPYVLPCVREAEKILMNKQFDMSPLRPSQVPDSSMLGHIEGPAGFHAFVGDVSSASASGE